MNAISDNTKAILLLTAPLIVSQKAKPAKILSLKDYNLLARALKTMGLQPQDLLGGDSLNILSELPSSFDVAKLKSLLGRGFLMGQALTEWQRRSIWVVSRADTTYPRRLKGHLREQSPPILYGCGDRALLDEGGLAVVGSRKITDWLKNYTENLGTLAAEAGVAIVSGAARGIDSSAMGGALMQGGKVIGVMADSLSRAALAKSNREALQNGRLVLISAYDPLAGFNVGHAMQRNKAIYALADAGLVVSSDFNKGGTWAGAIEQLDKLHYAPVFVREGQESGQGSSALIQRGGKTWPEPANAAELLSTLEETSSWTVNQTKQEEFMLGVNEDATSYPGSGAVIQSGEAEPSTARVVAPAERLQQAVSGILNAALQKPKSGDEVAELLEVSRAQANKWLKRLVEDGQIKKLSKPVRYQSTNENAKLGANAYVD